jgi:hypothetical protein
MLCQFLPRSAAQQSTARHSAAQRSTPHLDALLSDRIKGRGGFIQDQDGRVLQNGASKGDSLLLAATAGS